jgi:hypothetical protein
MMCMFSIEWCTSNIANTPTPIELISCSTFLLLLLHHHVSFFCQGFFQSVYLGNSSIVLTSLTFKWTRSLVTRNDASRFSFSPLNWQSMARYGCFLPRKWRCPINTHFFECLN